MKKKSCAWEAEVILFTKNWLRSIRQDPAWRDLYLYMIEQEWKKSSYPRNKIFYDLAISQAQANRNLKPNPYLTDTAKHLLSIAAGATVGFNVASDEAAIPLELIQKAYIDCYRLQQYAPTLIQPGYFNFSHNDMVYYSLQVPTTFEFSPKSRKISSTLNDLCELKHILSVFLSEINEGNLRVEDTILDKIAKEAKFHFYHSKLDMYGDIASTEEMIKADPALIRSPSFCNQNEFSSAGTFIRGCVRISCSSEDREKTSDLSK